MNNGKMVAVTAVGAAIAMTVMTACGKSHVASDTSAKTSESSVVTNDNGSVSKVFVECNVTTNGNMVTERRRETRTTTDTAGNVLATSTSEYAQSYTAGDASVTFASANKESETEPKSDKSTDSFLGVAFGSVFESEEFTSDPDDGTLLRAKFKPAKTLAGFDDYYVCVTPETHKVAKIYACAKQVVDPGAGWRRHYLVEALEKRYHTWARLCSFSRPCYAFDLGANRVVTACLAGASSNYETVIAAVDGTMLTTAAEETAEIRNRARKAASEKRERRVNDAAEAF